MIEGGKLDGHALFAKTNAILNLVGGDQLRFPMGWAHLIDGHVVVVDLADLVNGAVAADEVPSVTQALALDVLGDAFWSNHRDQTTQTHVVAQQGVKVAKVIDVGVGDKDRSESFAIAGT